MLAGVSVLGVVLEFIYSEYAGWTKEADRGLVELRRYSAFPLVISSSTFTTSGVKAFFAQRVFSYLWECAGSPSGGGSDWAYQ